jgi:endonuclease/exonuclease/phosphatase family metal-dependent hydrolase
LLRTIRHLLLVWFSLSATALAPALIIATYNVENYLVTDRLVDGVYREAYPKPEKEKAALRQVIAGIAPDILAVQEMGGAAYLDEFQRELKQAGQNFPYKVMLEGPDPDRHVAVLSKVPFKQVRRHAQVATTYFGQKNAVKRGVLEVIFPTSNGDFSLFVVHLKSRRTERPDDPESALLRAQEAVAVRDLVLSLYPNPAKARFIICGDWNDTRNSRPVRALTRRGELSLGEIIPAFDSLGETWTHFYRREDIYSRIDYFLVSPALKPAVTNGRASIWNGPGAGEGSDHRAVYLQLSTLEAAK